MPWLAKPDAMAAKVIPNAFRSRILPQPESPCQECRRNRPLPRSRPPDV
jgi:hypothetical protein